MQPLPETCQLKSIKANLPIRTTFCAGGEISLATLSLLLAAVPFILIPMGAWQRVELGRDTSLCYPVPGYSTGYVVLCAR